MRHLDIEVFLSVLRSFMQLSQTAEYALRAVVWLAEHIGDPQTTNQIAEGCRMPAGYLAKVLQPLAKAGVVSAQRGLGGGYVLERDVEGLSLLDVINAVEPVQRIRSCPLKLSTHGSRLCALHQTLDDAMAEVERRLREQTIAQLMSRHTGSKPLCESAAAGSAVTQLGIKRRVVVDSQNGSSNGTGGVGSNGSGGTLGTSSEGSV